MANLDFLERNKWLNYGPLEVYVRKSQIPFDLGPNLQIANVTVDEEHQQQGHFTRFLHEAESYAKEHEYAAVYVENVINPVLEKFLTKQGYEKIQQTRRVCLRGYDDLSLWTESNLYQ